MNRKVKVLIVITVGLLILGISCGIYVSDYYHADEPALSAMAGSNRVEVSQMDDLTVFAPGDPVAGLIFYPGGKVEYTAYSPLMLALAEQDILCVLLEMPFNLAVLDMAAAEGIPEQYPKIEHWFIGGHSLGGSMAASYAAEHAEDYAGLVLLAAYSTAEIADMDVISLYGSEDGVLNREKYQEYRGNLPESTEEIVIEGGNHAGFGSYGFQEGDSESMIPGETSGHYGRSIDQLHFESCTKMNDPSGAVQHRRDSFIR